MPGQRGRKKGSGKTKIAINHYLVSSQNPEEVLFKLNELLYGEQAVIVRKNPRIVANLSLLWKCGEEIRQGSTYTLSREGMFIKTPMPAEVNSEIEISFMIPEYPRLIRVKAQVVRKVPIEEALKQGLVCGMAVTFKEIDEEAQKKLDEFIQLRLKKRSKSKVWL